jgi:hypothetical protein
MNESERKTIQINPELFKVTGGNNTTRKKRSDPVNRAEIKVKDKKPKNISTIKRNILKMIRNQQQEKKKNNSTVEPTTTTLSSEFNNDFKNSLEYLSTLTADTESKLTPHNQTIKRYITPHHTISHTMETPVELNIPQNLEPFTLQPKPLILPAPKYGCLKGGTLPTYRTFMNQTVKNTPQMISPLKQDYEKRLEQNIKDLSRIQQQEKKFQQINHQTQQKNENKANKKMKQKRIIRRTYYVGRSKAFPKVSVLVANKTIRANTQLKTQHLKQIPMTEVRNYLLKNGFIKVGTNAPNDVLREMYESAQLMCGEIKNHNPDNLLYNYFNDNASTI